MIRGEDHLSNTPKHILLFRALGYPEPGLRPPAAHPQRRPDEDEQAQEPDRGRRLHRRGLHPRGARQLPGAPRLVDRHRGGDPLARRARRPASTSPTSRRAARSSTGSASSGSTASGSGASPPTTSSTDCGRSSRPRPPPAGSTGCRPTTRSRPSCRSSRSGCRRSARSATSSASCGSTDLQVDPAILVPKRWDAATTARRTGGRASTIAANGAVTFEADELEPPLRALAEARGWKAGDLFMAIRVAVTGRTATPPLFETLVALGYERTLSTTRRGAHDVLSRRDGRDDGAAMTRDDVQRWLDATSRPGRATTPRPSATCSARTPSTGTTRGTSR